MSSYDVIIVGAGPAGATLGRELCHRGLAVLIVEKEKLPREKPCAGGITLRAASLLDFDIGPVTEGIAYGARITYRLSDECIKRHNQPLVHMVMRSRFDHFLVKKAQEAGAVVSDGVRADQLEMTASGVRVLTAEGPITAKVVAAADGARGTVGRKLGMIGDFELGLALEDEVYVTRDKLADWDSLIGLDIGQIPGGYGWVFPKRDHLSVGVGGPLHLSKRLKPYLERLLRHLGKNDIDDFTGHLLPLRRRGMAIQRGNALLLGDAAGLVHPLTGEGIYYAIRSAQLAAPVITESLRSGTIDLKGYQRAVDDQLMPSLELGRVLLNLFAWSPRFYFDLASRSDRVWSYAWHALMGTWPVCI